MSQFIEMLPNVFDSVGSAPVAPGSSAAGQICYLVHPAFELVRTAPLPTCGGLVQLIGAVRLGMVVVEAGNGVDLMCFDRYCSSSRWPGARIDDTIVIAGRAVLFHIDPDGRRRAPHRPFEDFRRAVAFTRAA